MSLAILSLEHLLVDLRTVDDKQVQGLGRNLYGQLYLNRGHVGVHRTHDGAVLIFHKNQFDHAFFTTSDRLCHPERKDVLRKASVERIRWIEPVVTGRVVGSACFEVPSPTGRNKPPNRLYAVYSTPYVVWLEPRKEGGWKFSTAYPLSIAEIHKYSRGGRTVWKYKEKSPVIDGLTGPQALSRPIKV